MSNLTESKYIFEQIKNEVLRWQNTGIRVGNAGLKAVAAIEDLRTETYSHFAGRISANSTPPLNEQSAIYIFSSSGVVTWITDGAKNVNIGDILIVTYENSSYTYEWIKNSKGNVCSTIAQMNDVEPGFIYGFELDTIHPQLASQRGMFTCATVGTGNKRMQTASVIVADKARVYVRFGYGVNYDVWRIVGNESTGDLGDYALIDWVNEYFVRKGDVITPQPPLKLTFTTGNNTYLIDETTPDNVVIEALVDGVVYLPIPVVNRSIQFQITGTSEVEIDGQMFGNGTTVFATFDVEDDIWTITSTATTETPVIPNYRDVTVDKMYTTGIMSLVSGVRHRLLYTLGALPSNTLLLYANPAYKSLNGLYVVLFSNQNGSVITCDKLAGYDALNTVRVKNGKVYLCDYNGNEEHTVQFTPIDNQDNKFRLISTTFSTTMIPNFNDISIVKQRLASWINTQGMTIGATEILVFEVINYVSASKKHVFILKEKGKGLLNNVITNDLILIASNNIDILHKDLQGKNDEEDFQHLTTTEKNKLAGIQVGAQVNTVTSVAGRTGAVVLNKSDVGLGNADNTSDLNKPISTATQTALNGKAAKTIQKTNITLTQGNWVYSSGFWRYDIPDSDITQLKIVDVIPKKESSNLVQYAFFLEENESFAGYVRVYSRLQPQGDIIVTLNISE